MNLSKIADLYQVDRRVLYAIARTAMWGARKSNGRWNFDDPPINEYTMTVSVVADAIRCSREIVRRWCRESDDAQRRGRPVKLRAIQVGRSWRIHYEDGAHLIMAQLGGFKK
jgi:hypothetical protein